MDNNILIEKMNIIDLEKIKSILADDFDDFWNYNILKEELSNKNSKYIVARLDDEIVGFAGIKIILDEADIMNIVVKKTYRNKGIGTLLLNYIINLSKEMNLKSITLEVSEKNLVAINMYKNLGFMQMGKRKKYYECDNAILMSRNL